MEGGVCVWGGWSCDICKIVPDVRDTAAVAGNTVWSETCMRMHDGLYLIARWKETF